MKIKDRFLESPILSNFGNIVGSIILVAILLWIAGYDLNINIFDQIEKFLGRYWKLITAVFAPSIVSFPIWELIQKWKLRKEVKDGKIFASSQLGLDTATALWYPDRDDPVFDRLLWSIESTLSLLRISPSIQSSLIKSSFWDEATYGSIVDILKVSIKIEHGHYCASLFYASCRITELYHACIYVRAIETKKKMLRDKAIEVLDRFNEDSRKELRITLDKIGLRGFEIPTISALNQESITEFAENYFNRIDKFYEIPDFYKLPGY